MAIAKFVNGIDEVHGAIDSVKEGQARRARLVCRWRPQGPQSYAPDGSKLHELFYMRFHEGPWSEGATRNREMIKAAQRMAHDIERVCYHPEEFRLASFRSEMVPEVGTIMRSGKFELGPDAYRFKFASDNTERVEAGTIKDFIYAMPYHTTQATGMQYGRSHSYKDIKNMNPSYYGEQLTNSGGGYVTMVPEFVKLFNLKGDERNKLIIGLSEDLDDYRYDTGKDENTVYVYDPKTLLPTSQVALNKEGNPLKISRNINLVEKDFTINVGDNLDGWRQGCRTTKWHVTRSDFANGRNQSNDIPLMRYAEILLTKAEALTRQGSSSEAKDLVNQVRAYANAELLANNPTLDDIYQERGREFFDENLRRADMIRFGHFEDEYFPHYKDFPTANFDKTRRVFPINGSMLDLNPKWKQNAGY